MRKTKEIKALLHLLDDPDKEIFETVSEKIIDYGKAIIPNLEEMWEHTTDGEVQVRIEDIIHKVNFTELIDKMNLWHSSENPNLFDGAIILSQYRFSDSDENACRKVMKGLYQSCWLELNNYLTPLEQINILNSILYSMYKFKGMDLEENNTNHYFITEVMESRIGNSYSIGLIYQYLCNMLDIPVFAIQLPRQYLLAYFDIESNYFEKDQLPKAKIQFYIDPSNGMIFSQNDVDVYIKKYDLKVDDNTYKALNSKRIMKIKIESIIQVYEQIKDYEKADELNKLLNLFEDKA